MDAAVPSGRQRLEHRAHGEAGEDRVVDDGDRVRIGDAGELRRERRGAGQRIAAGVVLLAPQVHRVDQGEPARASMDLRRHPGAGAADADRRGERDVLATRDQRVELLVERQDDDALVGTQALEERLTELLRVRAMSLQFGGEIVVDVERAGDRRRHADSAGRARTRPNLHPASVYHSSSARPASASIASVDSRVNL